MAPCAVAHLGPWEMAGEGANSDQLENMRPQLQGKSLRISNWRTWVCLVSVLVSENQNSSLSGMGHSEEQPQASVPRPRHTWGMP